VPPLFLKKGVSEAHIQYVAFQSIKEQVSACLRQLSARGAVPISEPSIVAPQSGGYTSGSVTSMSDIEVDPPLGPATPAYATGFVGHSSFPGPSIMASGYGVIPTSGEQSFPPCVREVQPPWVGQTVHVDEAGYQWVRVVPKPPSAEGSDLLSEQASEIARRDFSLGPPVYTFTVVRSPRSAFELTGDFGTALVTSFSDLG
jgi:hypothetical protein